MASSADMTQEGELRWRHPRCFKQEGSKETIINFNHKDKSLTPHRSVSEFMTLFAKTVAERTKPGQRQDVEQQGQHQPLSPRLPKSYDPETS